MTSLRDEYTRVAYRERVTLKCYTPGTFRMSDSPFTSGKAITDAIAKQRGGTWKFIGISDDRSYVGGRGNVAQAVNGHEAVMIWEDARGGWWIERVIRPTWYTVDTVRTLQLAGIPDDDEIDCPTFPDHESHPDW